MNTFQLTIIGSGSAVPSSHRAATSQVVQYDNKYIMIDCAEGTQMQLKRNKVSPMRIEHFFISHLHGDHYFGLIGLINTLHLIGKTSPIHLHGPAVLLDIIRLQLKAADTTLRFPLLFHPLKEGCKHLMFEDEHLRYWSFPVVHRIPTWGFVFEEKQEAVDAALSEMEEAGDQQQNCHPRSYAFCTDTAFRPELADYFRGVDLLYHESTFEHHLAKTAEATFHSTNVQAAEMAKAAEVKRLLLGHFSSRYTDLTPMLDEAREVFQNTLLALDGSIFDI